jgi:hypothetical protein
MLLPLKRLSLTAAPHQKDLLNIRRMARRH